MLDLGGSSSTKTMYVPSWKGVKGKDSSWPLTKKTTHHGSIRKSITGLSKPGEGAQGPSLPRWLVCGVWFLVGAGALVLVVDSNYTSNTCLWRGRQVEVKSRRPGANYLCSNPCPTTMAWDPEPQAASLSLEVTTAPRHRAAGESVRQVHRFSLGSHEGGTANWGPCTALGCKHPAGRATADPSSYTR